MIKPLSKKIGILENLLDSYIVINKKKERERKFTRLVLINVQRKNGNIH